MAVHTGLQIADALPLFLNPFFFMNPIQPSQPNPSAPLYPELHLRLIGEDGNAFAILGRAKRLMQTHGLKPAEIDRFLSQAKAGDYNHLLETCQRWFSCDSEPAPDVVLADIAAQCLDIGTLQTRNRDQLDFHEVSVWSLNEALLRAYDAGKASAVGTKPYSQINDQLRIDLLGQFAQTATNKAEQFVAFTCWTAEDPLEELYALAANGSTDPMQANLADAAKTLLGRLRLEQGAD
ncbi:DUF6900 domain-containing protein [Pseudooceanicola atlanticus]|uniref:DUF6900 domain-containing protein n=1 Tax=Pseudooceanicola atlanticus TaxID=1461694 RepID=UPI002354570E|nr:hypothetical protein [Pseudooceanicola atlanticus]